MSSKPILFNTEMVKAILDGKKTQTIRVIPLKNNDLIFTGSVVSSTAKNREGYCAFGKNKEQDLEFIKPKYKVGDILYVRETFLIGEYGDYYNGEGTDDSTIIEQYSTSKDVIYYADAIDIVDYYSLYGADKPIWKPSIHMPKKYARIFLKVTNVRVERLQEAELQDICEEGYPEGYQPFYFTSDLKRELHENKMDDWWINLWNSTAKDGCKWEDNPYVFVYEFERIERQ